MDDHDKSASAKRQSIRRKKQKAKKICIYARNAFLICLLLTIMQMVFIAMNGPYQGSIPMKIYQFYTDSSIYLKKRCLPIYTAAFFMLYIVYLIKSKMHDDI